MDCGISTQCQADITKSKKMKMAAIVEKSFVFILDIFEYEFVCEVQKKLKNKACLHEVKSCLP